MQQYKDLLDTVMTRGTHRNDRTGVGCTSYFGPQIRFDLSKGFPLSTLRGIKSKFWIKELFWFLRGETNIETLDANIWNEWALMEDEILATGGVIKKGSIGPMYGRMWTEFPGFETENFVYPSVNQIKEVIRILKQQPDSRRIVVSAWHPSVLPDETISPIENVKAGRASLAACHTLFQFNTRLMKDGKRYLDCKLYARSQDLLIGTPANIASYALLTHLMAREVGMEAGDYIHTCGDAHIYNFESHLKAYETLMEREPRPLPKLVINSDKSLFELTADDIELEGYDPHPGLGYLLDRAV